MGFKGIVFDLDGTLLDTLQDIGDAANRTLKARGFPMHAPDAYRFFVGDGFLKLITRALPETERKTETIDRCLALFRADYATNWNRKTRPYPGIPDLLDALSRKAFKMAVLSNKAHDFTVQMVAALLPRWTFHRVLGLRGGVPAKPDPFGADEIARDLELKPSEMIYLGDSGVDMKTAVAARMFPAGALWGFRPARELEESGAQILLQAPMELLTLLG